MNAHEGRVRTTRLGRFWALGWEVARPAEIWYVLHGYGQLARRFLRRFESLDDGTRVVIAPEALMRFYVDGARGRHGPASRVGATWMTREDREADIADYVAYLDRLLAETPGPGDAKVVVLGFSQGVATAARWTTLGRVRPHRLILWGDTLPPDLDAPAAAKAWRGVEVVRVRGTGDGAFSAGRVELEDAMLAAAGITARVVRYDGGHEIDPATLSALARER